MSIGEDDNQPVHPTKSQMGLATWDPFNDVKVKAYKGSQKHETASLCIHKKVVWRSTRYVGFGGARSEKAAPPSEDQRHSKALVPS